MCLVVTFIVKWVLNISNAWRQISGRLIQPHPQISCTGTYVGCILCVYIYTVVWMGSLHSIFLQWAERSIILSNQDYITPCQGLIEPHSASFPILCISRKPSFHFWKISTVLCTFYVYIYISWSDNRTTGISEDRRHRHTPLWTSHSTAVFVVCFWFWWQVYWICETDSMRFVLLQMHRYFASIMVKLKSLANTVFS